MDLYFAPLEGITGYIYRSTHREFFGGCDMYYAPFITPVENERLNRKCMRDILPENNEGVPLVVQVLANKKEAYFRFENEALAFGYRNININFGCPSGTVVKKDRGAGFLREREALDGFLGAVFEETSAKISVKTRIGFYSSDEMEYLMEIYNKYPMELLIVHPRTREDYYKGFPDMECFKKVYSSSQNKLCYNGDVFSTDGFNTIAERFPELHSVMIGRGAISNPAIFREIRGGEKLSTDEILAFSDELAKRYYEVLKSDMYTLHKLKEVWMYMMQNFPEEKKILKAVKKSSTVAELKSAVQSLPSL